jgi:hypothetical protein
LQKISRYDPLVKTLVVALHCCCAVSTKKPPGGISDVSLALREALYERSVGARAPESKPRSSRSLSGDFFCVVDKKERRPGEGTPPYVSLKASTPMNLVVKARLCKHQINHEKVLCTKYHSILGPPDLIS